MPIFDKRTCGRKVCSSTRRQRFLFAAVVFIFNFRRDGQVGSIGKSQELRVLSYSLYGYDRRYMDGALTNSAAYKQIFPGWQMWVYFDSTVPISVLNAIKANDVTLINMTHSDLSPMTWRFLIASNKSVARYCVRDIDSRLLKREHTAVEAWVESEFPAHIIRDHPSHIVSKVAIPGGMWCARRDTFPTMSQHLARANLAATYNADQEFLREVVWPTIQSKVLQHVSFNCEEHENYRRMPRRSGLEHVGAVYLGGLMRESDLKLLRKAIQRGEQC